MLDFELTKMVEKELSAEEELLWCSRPDPNYNLYKSMISVKFLLGFFLVLVCGGVLLNIINGSIKDVGQMGMISTVLLTLVGLVLISYPIRRYIKDTKTIFAVSKSRCIIFYYKKIATLEQRDGESYQKIIMNRSQPMEAFDVLKIKNIDCIVRDDGSGDLIITIDNPTDVKLFDKRKNIKLLDTKQFDQMENMIKDNILNRFVFYAIKDVRWVEKTIKDCITSQRLVEKTIKEEKMKEEALKQAAASAPPAMPTGNSNLYAQANQASASNAQDVIPSENQGGQQEPPDNNSAQL